MKFVVPLKPAAVELGGTLSLLCELNQASGDVVWKHDSHEVKPGGRHCVRTDGPRRLLTVTAVAKEDEGEYSCECRNDKTSAKVSTKGSSSSAGALNAENVPLGVITSRPMCFQHPDKCG